MVAARTAETFCPVLALEPRIVAPVIVVRATDAPPRRAFDITAPWAEGRATFARILDRDVVARETADESFIDRILDWEVDEPRGLGAWAANASSPQHVATTKTKQRKKLIRFNTKLILSVIHILSFFGYVNQAHFAH